MSEIFKIEKVAVLGTGVMGAQIAAHLTNAKIPVLAFDISQEIANKGVEASTKLKPSAYYNPKTVEMITPLNYEEHIDQICECDWVIEVIAERLDWKQDLYKKIQPHLKKDAVITSNTSGISIAELIDGMDNDIASRFFITHFFNPPRYMKLVEIIRGHLTSDETAKKVVEISSDLNKVPVECNDYPGFIANRILMPMINEAIFCKMEGVAETEAIDQIMKLGMAHPMGPLTLADLIGLDVCLAILEVLHKELGDSKYRACALLKKMVDAGTLGRKTGQGVYNYI